jgi:plastocyanin
MNRRLTVAVAATAVLGMALAPAAGAAKKNEIRITGGAIFKPGVMFADAVHFNKNTTVKSGGTVKVVNKSPKAGPHSISLVKKSALPETVAQAEACFEFAGVCGPLAAAHQFDPETMEPAVPLFDAGAEGFDTMGGMKKAGDSIFFAPGQPVSFKVTADKGSKLTYFCAVHPWMQGKITVN